MAAMLTRQDSFTGFDPYKLMGVKVTDNIIGHGSYATVLELEYMGLKCAGKKIHDVLLKQDSTYIASRFGQECRLLAQIRHPNIVQFLGVFFTEGEEVPILVMEYLPTNLKACIEVKGVLPQSTSYSILHDIALALCYLHSQEPPIIHRDLSANNILLTANMKAKISDLGMARIVQLNPLQVSYMTETPGTPIYMPPEVMIANPSYDTSIDEFSYGVLIVHVLTGKWPEPQCSQIRMEGGKMIPVSEAERRRIFLQEIGSEHPLMDLILRCIDNDPKQRANANEIMQIITRIIAAKQKNVSPTAPLAPSPYEIAQVRNVSIDLPHPVDVAKKKTPLKKPIPAKRKSKELPSVPAMVELEDWYFGNIERALAISKCKKDGDFVVRFNDIKQRYIITSQWKGQCSHYTLDKDDSGKYSIIGSSRSFKSVQELITFYTSTGESLNNSEGDQLLQHVSKKDKWNVKYTEIEVQMRIGTSAFGDMCIGSYAQRKVSIKTYAGDKARSINQFLLEVEVLKEYSHPNVARLVAACLEPNPNFLNNPVYLIMEHAPGGVFRHYLQEKEFLITTNQICRMCADACKGLEYIHSMKRAHCDVATRSCLVGYGKIVKIANLGMSTDFSNNSFNIQPTPKNALLPVRWSPPEVLNLERHIHSDIWSFGVFLWEAFSFGREPYPDMDEYNVLTKVKEGYHMDPPAMCHPEISKIMLECWKFDPKQRPSFTALIKRLETAQHHI